jgi:hypothetical protein
MAPGAGAKPASASDGGSTGSARLSCEVSVARRARPFAAGLASVLASALVAFRAGSALPLPLPAALGSGFAATFLAGAALPLAAALALRSV